jgi:hypothetical protein
MKRRRLRDLTPSFFANEPPLPEFASTTEEIRRTVQRNAVQRGQFFALNLARLGFDQILDQVEALAREADSEMWRERAEEMGIDSRALDVLDRVAIRYAFYFCDPQQLAETPALVAYYRNVAMVSAKVMRGIGLDTASNETGAPFIIDRAEQIAKYLNSTVSALITSNPSLVTGRRHIEMALANLGESIGGSWRNEVGRLAYAEVIGGFLRYLHAKGFLSTVSYDLKGPLYLDEEEEESAYLEQGNLLSDGPDFLHQLSSIESNRVVYKTIALRNGHELRLNRQIEWRDKQGTTYKIGPDLSAFTEDETLNWGGELKGGADPAGSDEHWKTATRAFDRILTAVEQTGRSRPKLSFIATILVDRVAREAALWIQEGKLTSVYNLAQITESETKRSTFYADLARFLGCEE